MASAFRTITLQLYRPGAQKRRILDAALERYAGALQYLLGALAPAIEQYAHAPNATRAAAARLITPQTGCALARFAVEPFRDSLKADFANLVYTYAAQCKRRPAARAPCIRLEEEEYRKEIDRLLARLDSGEIGENAAQRELERLLSRLDATRGIYFGRYSANREYCLLYDEEKERFYAKLTLLNAQNRVPAGEGAGRPMLRVVAPGLPFFRPKGQARRFLVLPLAFGQYQRQVLLRALEEPGVLRTARLYKKKGGYYLSISVAAFPGGIKETGACLGLSRAAGGVRYAVRLPGGQIAREGWVPAGKGAAAANRLAGEIAAVAAEFGALAALEKAGGKNDGLPAFFEPAIPPADYEALARALQKKLPAMGLPAPVRFRAEGIFDVCPSCGARAKASHAGEKTFICVACGYACAAERVACLSLAARPGFYRSTKIPIESLPLPGGKVRFFNALLGLDLIAARKEGEAALREGLSRLAEDMEYQPNAKRYAMLQKLRGAENMLGVVRIVEHREPPKTNG